MLTTHFCKETVTHYSGSNLDRVAYLREDKQFLDLALEHPTTRFLPLRKLNPKVKDADKGSDIAYMSYNEVKQFIPASNLVFLGVDRNATGFEHPRVSGIAYWSIDLTAQDVADAEDYRSVFIGVRLPKISAALYAQARHLTDWISRNKYCAACGSKTKPDQAGYHLVCENPECATKKGISNISFPRTDASIIVAVLDYKGENILVGRGKRFPPNMYSCLAGFLEPGESVEDCVRREVMEEAGVKVGHVTIHSSQPWPYPANIMLGCLAQIADPSEESHKIDLGNDPELADAKWLPVETVRSLCALRGKMSEEHDMFIPPPSAIAWVLLDTLSKLYKSKV